MSTSSKSQQALKIAIKSWGSPKNSIVNRKTSMKTAAQKQMKGASLNTQASEMVVLRDVFLEVFGERSYLVHLKGVEVPLLVTVYEFMESLQHFVCVDENELWNFIPLSNILYMTEYAA